MNKEMTMVLCSVCLVVSVAAGEGLPVICKTCAEEKKQPHIEVSQPTGAIQQVGTSSIAGISDSASVSPSTELGSSDQRS